MELTLDKHRCNSQVARTAMKNLLERYGKFLVWDEDKKEKIIDVGCGEASATLEILYPAIKDHIEELVLSDKHPYMLKLAKLQCPHENVTFRELDVADEEIDDVLVGAFDRVFSFYFVQLLEPDVWVRTFNKLLRPNGRVLLTYTSSNDAVVDVYKSLCYTNTWNKHICYRECVYTLNTISWVLMYMQNGGFKIVYNTNMRVTHRFEGVDSVKEYVRSLRYLKDIPYEEQEEFVNVFTEKLLKLIVDEEGGYTLIHDFAIIAAQKNSEVPENPRGSNEAKAP